MITSIIGIGLIGGSFALELKKINASDIILGVDTDKNHLDEALALNIIDEATSFDVAIKRADLILLATPVNTSVKLIKSILDNCNSNTVIFDVGSLKSPICKKIANHPKRAQFVAVHPIAGTEFSGPSAAHLKLFNNKVNIICDDEKSAPIAIKQVTELFERMGSKNIMMESNMHDKHITYVSHLSHITSFALSLTVQALEKTEQNIFNMAGSGFSSTVRLAKSSASMWVPIFNENKANMIAAIDAYIDQLKDLKKYIQDNNSQELMKKINQANLIKNSLPE